MTSPEVVSLAEDAGLREPLDRLYEEGWPAFMAADPVEQKWWPRLLEAAPHLQLALVENGEVIASAHATPLDWRPGDPLPDEGWDWAIETGVKAAETRRQLPAACALAITIEPSRRGQGLGRRMLGALRQHTAEAGGQDLVGPVRPDGKALRPDEPMDVYLRRHRPDGLPKDGWLRAHVRFGAEIVGVCSRSMTIAAPLDQWEAWTGVAHRPGTPYIVPQALVPLQVDGRVATYVEPNIWVVHSLA
jgi:GNAT superfamily N-acetyltransferase